MNESPRTNNFSKIFVIPASLIIALTIGCKKKVPILVPQGAPTLVPSTVTPVPTATPIGGGQGVIAFSSNLHDVADSVEIYTVNIDGTNLQRLTNVAAGNWSPDWSPDGTQLVFHSDRAGVEGIYRMNADGSAQTLIVPSGTALHASWSPDASQILFSQGSPPDLWTVNPDGTGLSQLTFTVEGEYSSHFSPDGSKIVHSRDTHIYKMNSDTTGLTQLTTAGGTVQSDANPKWSPDGVRIVFWSSRFFGSAGFLINPDGTGETQFFDPNPGVGILEPNWSPDGTRIVYSSWAGIYTIYPDGTVPVTVNSGPPGVLSIYPAWK